MTIFKRLFSLCAVVALVACGGGGGSAGTAPFGPGSGTGGGGTGGGGTGGGTGAGNPSLTLSISSPTVTSTSPATVTLTLLDAANAPVAGRVVSLSTARSGLAALSATSVLTGSNGQATVGVQAASGGLVGADEVLATVSLGTTTVSGSVGFNVAGATATIAAEISATTLRASAGPATFTATLRNEAGQALPNQVVSFSSAQGLVTLGTTSALTDGLGRASTIVAPTSASTNAADTVAASTTVNGRQLQSSINVQLVGESPSIAVVLSSSNISATIPATVSATVRDSAGNLVNGAIVSFSTAFNLGQFDNATALSVNGVASAVVSPRVATATGADFVRASVTVAGVTVNAQQAAQFTGSATVGNPVLQLALSSTSVSAASPATVTATLTDARGVAVAGQVVSFNVVRGLARTNVSTALTAANGSAVVVLSPASATSAGADEVTATVNYAGASLQASQGFQVQATAVTLDSFAALDSPLSAYGQTTLTLGLTGASVTSPVGITVSSSCVAANKATISPSSFTATGNTVTLQYRDNGCGAVQTSDQIQAVVTSTGGSRSLALPINSPAQASVAFVQAAPEQIFLRGSGFTESSIITFEVRDAAGNPLPGQVVELRLQTGAGGVTMEGRGVESVNPPSANPFTLTSNALGRVAVRVNSGTLPTPVRVNARLASSNPVIATVSSNLSVAVGLPSQLNFSFSQQTKNIEGYNIDGTPNVYNIIAADRSGNPVPAGTSINFVAEGGQIEAIKQTQLVNGLARTSANFVSAEPRPVDGRVTITVYALGEESFLDLNGNNAFDAAGSLNLPIGPIRDAGEPFQDLGNIFRDRNFDGSFDSAVDEFIPLSINNASQCAAPGNGLLNLDPSIPSVLGTCDTQWSGAGQVYVRRALETVLSTSAARPLWASTRGLDAGCVTSRIAMQVGPRAADPGVIFTLAGQDTWYGGTTDTLGFIVADANPGSTTRGLLPRLNPMAAGSTITATTPTTGMTVSVGGGTPVPNTTEATTAAVVYNFTDPAVNFGIAFVTFRSPSGLGTTIAVPIVRGPAPSVCPAS